MGDKCDSHDDCFKRLYNKVEALSADIRSNFMELKDMHHQKEVSLALIENRLEQCEKRLAHNGTNWKAFFVDVLGGVIKVSIPAMAAMMWWASQNGYGK